MGPLRAAVSYRKSESSRCLTDLSHKSDATFPKKIILPLRPVNDKDFGKREMMATIILSSYLNSIFN